jgi:hypothetical protein
LGPHHMPSSDVRGWGAHWGPIMGPLRCEGEARVWHGLARPPRLTRIWSRSQALTRQMATLTQPSNGCESCGEIEIPVCSLGCCEPIIWRASPARDKEKNATANSCSQAGYYGWGRLRAPLWAHNGARSGRKKKEEEASHREKYRVCVNAYLLNLFTYVTYGSSYVTIL